MTAPSVEIGRAPSSPWGLSAREWVDVFKRAFKSFLADDAMGLSAQVAFSSLLAFFPAVVFLVGLLDLVGAYDTLKEFLAPVAPGDVLKTIDTLQQDTSKGTSVVAFVVGAAGAIWAASGAMGAVIKAVNRAYDRVETRPFWKTRLIAIVLVVLMGLVLAGLLLLIVFGGPLGTAIADKAGLGGAFELLWAILRWPIAFVAILLFFGLVYYLAPNVDIRSWKWLTPGSLVGSVMWLALSGLFALYTSLSDSYSKTYGALASGVVLLLWLNYSAFALLFGAELNSELDRQAEIRASGGENAGLIKPSRRG
ncbi:MAG: rane protein [Gaiellaceae bacterium]|nr:rane protein [Gaiellaceae bacterium]